MPVVRQRVRRRADLTVTGPVHDRRVSDITIDCDDCIRQHTPSCDDCVVTFICSRSPDEALVVDVTDRLALRQLHAVGLVPELRHVPRSG